MTVDTAYLRKMIQERGDVSIYGNGVDANQELCAEGRVLIVGDVGQGARVSSGKQIFVIGNVGDGVTLAASSGSVLITGKTNGRLHTVDKDNNAISIAICCEPEDMLSGNVHILGHDDAQSEMAVYEAMEWVGTHIPLTKPRSLMRKFAIAAGAVAGGSVAALGFSGLQSLGVSPSADVHMVFNAMAHSPIWTLCGAWAGGALANSGRPKLGPLVLRHQSMPIPRAPYWKDEKKPAQPT